MRSDLADCRVKHSRPGIRTARGTRPEVSKITLDGMRPCGRVSAVPQEALPQADGRSCGPTRNRSPDDAAPPSATLLDRPSENGFHPRQPDGSLEREDGAQARAASCSDRQVQRLALTPVISIPRLRREHEPECVDDVRARLCLRASLAEDAGDLRDRGDDPSFLAGLVDDRQVKLLWHMTNDTDPSRCLVGFAGSTSTHVIRSAGRRFPARDEQPCGRLDGLLNHEHEESAGAATPAQTARASVAVPSAER
jgi:hypothetical protein